MDIVETSTWTIGRFTIHKRPRFDNPAWAVFLVYCGEELVGKQASYPSLTDCEWLLRQGIYAESSARVTLRERPGSHLRGGRATKSKFRG